MHRKLWSFSLPVILLCLLSAGWPTAAQAIAAGAFGVQGDHFALNGKPFQIVSGSMHYTRIPRAAWRDRLRKARAMGLNTIETYAFWNAHETSPGVFDFSGNNDIAEFIREAQQEGLYVILRPGPYVCAEWEFGGYPAWLLKDRSLTIRSQSPAFLQAAERWLRRLGQETAPLQIGNGGPILAVQVENEYGSYGDDRIYMERIHQMLVAAGFTKAMFYTADGPDLLAKGSLAALPAAINFGPGEARGAFAQLKKFRPNGPFLCGEYWDGWFDHWGEKHHTTDSAQQAEELQWMLTQGYSVNLYMFDGGTSFGWMNGANSSGSDYQPDVTSYDYDVAVGEGGELRPKYFAFRRAIQQATGVTPPDPPKSRPPAALPAVSLVLSASLWTALPPAIHAENPLSMEDVDQAYGYILYRTTLHGPASGVLHIDQLHDYARIYLDGKLAGTLDRRLGQSELTVHSAAASAQLDILVENSGRVNYGKALAQGRAGISGPVLLAGQPLTGWEIFPLPMQNTTTLAFSTEPCSGPCFYLAVLQIDGQPSDTFLDTRALSKGFVWVNGHALGRVWSIGPQETLYLPASWMRPGANQIVVFDLDGAPGKTVQGMDRPILDDVTNAPNSPAAPKQ